MKVVCAWCQRAGNFVVLREKEPPGDEISHGICDEHILTVMADVRRRRMIDGPLGSPRQHRTERGRSTLIPSEQQVRKPVMSRLLIIVSRDAPGRFAYLRHLYGSETVEVMVDRRARERRQRYQLAVNERRWQSRRRRDLTEELDNFGWTLIRR